MSGTPSANGKRSTRFDRHIGSRLRLAREGRGLSQSALGEALGISFQQLQKYEHGANRISAGRLFEATHLLGVEISYFFEGLPGRAPISFTSPPTDQASNLLAMIYAIPESRVRNRLLLLIAALSTFRAESPKHSSLRIRLPRAK